MIENPSDLGNFMIADRECLAWAQSAVGWPSPDCGQRAVARLRKRIPLRDPLPADLASLTERELDVTRLIAHGLTNAEIATRLFLGETTVKSHVTSILAKLGARDRVQVVVRCYEAGLIRPGRST